MKLSDIEKFEFVTLEYEYRYKIDTHKATNAHVLKAIILTLKDNGYEFYKLWPDSKFVYAVRS